MNPQGALFFLLDLAFSLYIFLVITRFVLQLVRADFYNPISQFIVRATNPLLVPLRRIIPGYGGIDSASIVLTFVLIIAKICVFTLIRFDGFLPIMTLVLLSVREFASLLLDFVFYSIFLRVIFSWISPDPRSPVHSLLIQVTEPVMAPVRKVIPPIGMLDLSPLIVLFGVQFMKILFGLH